MKRKFLILLILLAPFTAFSQKIITLKGCYDKAADINALALEKEAYTASELE
jgi:hypothetical protein